MLILTFLWHCPPGPPGSESVCKEFAGVAKCWIAPEVEGSHVLQQKCNKEWYQVQQYEQQQHGATTEDTTTEDTTTEDTTTEETTTEETTTEETTTEETTTQDDNSSPLEWDALRNSNTVNAFAWYFF